MDIRHADISTFPFLGEVYDVTNGVGKGKGSERKCKEFKQYFLLKPFEEFKQFFFQKFLR